MKKKTNKYSRKVRISFKDIFKKNKNLKEPLEEEINLQNQNNDSNKLYLILGYLGVFIIIAGIICILPIFTMIFYHNEFNRILAFLLPCIISVGIGFGLTTLLKKTQQIRLGKYQDFILLILIWLFSCLICAIPFALPDYIGSFRLGGLGISYTKALYETVSGFATCGLSILSGEISPSNLLVGDGHCFLFYRALLQFFGGVGFVLLLTCIINDNQGISLYYSEGHTDRLLPNLYKSAKLIFGIYLLINLVGSLLLWVSGINEWTKINKPAGCDLDPDYASYFEALCTTMSSVSGGGFSTRTMSIYAYNNVAIEIVVEILMIFSATNFFIIFLLFTFKFKKVIKDLDVTTSIYTSLIFIPLIIILSSITPSLANYKPNFLESVRYDVFFYISAITTTGFTNAPSLNYAFNTPVIFLLALVMFIGGQQGSTAGGIKMYRFGLIVKSIFWTIREKYTPQNTIYPHYVYKYGQDRPVTQKEIQDACTYSFLYISLVFFLAILFALSTNGNYNFLFVFFEISSALSDTGISSGINYLNNNFLLTIITIAMLVGRLEIFTFIYAGQKIFIDAKEGCEKLTKKIKEKHS